MSKVFGDVFPKENWFILKGSTHDSLPKAVFTMDKDKDKQSDMIAWLLAQ